MEVNFLEPQFQYRGRNKKKMILIIFFCLVLGGLLVGTTWAGARIFGNPEQTNNEQLQPIDNSTFWGKMKSLFVSANRPLQGYDADRINIALTGIGGAGHDGPQLTDTILVASIKPSTKQVALLSIPRDTVVNIPDYGWRKINEVNAYAEQAEPGSGGRAAADALEKFLGVSIPYYIRVDFSGFEQIIDDINGVDVYVDRAFSDFEYPNETYGVQTVSFSKGWQHLDGKQALIYARSRHGNNFEGSDFARAHRQQKILLAVRDKFLSSDTLLHPGRLASVIRTLDTHILTNLQFNDLMEFLRLGKELKTDQIINIVFSDDPNSVLVADDSTGAFYLRPKDPTLNTIHSLAENIFDANVSDGAKTLIDQQPLKPEPKSDARLEIQNGTWRPGFAARQKNRLETDGFKVSAVGNAAVRPITKAQIFDVTKRNPVVLEKLRKRYDAEIITTRPATSPDNISNPPTNIDIIVILGENVSDLAE